MVEVAHTASHACARHQQQFGVDSKTSADATVLACWRPILRREKLGKSLVYLAIVCCGTMLIGAISGLLVHFFLIREWLAILAAVVPGILLLRFFIWAGG